MFMILLLSCIIIGLIALGKKLPAAPTAAGSMVMALGIFVHGIWQHLTGQPLTSLSARLLIIGIVLVWLYLLASYLTSIRRSTFYEDHVSHPVERFAIGTWVAGTSALLMNLYTGFNADWLNETVHIMATLNLGLWLFYMGIVVQGWYKLATDSHSQRIDSVILLPAVATQSIVLMCHQVFQLPVGVWLSRTFIILGLLCYVIGVALMVWRYRRMEQRSVQNWKITYCITYGSLAITGVAISLTGAWSSGVSYGFWWASLIVLVIVESAETVRAIWRIRAYGWRTGVGRYHTAQWTRIFTLGIFYFLTIQTVQTATGNVITMGLHNVILSVGTWIIGILLVMELIVWFQKSFMYHPAVPAPAAEHTHSQI
ncbi:hypothetical protein ACE3MZ_11050 [Paenibacillus sp. WLX1005]|uniref:SLAC1 family transporter n=1 Tax=Paenibacillus sp. WLX1005 TaxID=3243766 RepID=UPI00398449AB